MINISTCSFKIKNASLSVITHGIRVHRLHVAEDRLLRFVLPNKYELEVNISNKMCITQQHNGTFTIRDCGGILEIVAGRGSVVFDDKTKTIFYL